MEDDKERRVRSQHREVEIYRPGSGPLKRSNKSNSLKCPAKNVVTNTNACNEEVNRNNQKNDDKVLDSIKQKCRKPDVSIYVTKFHRNKNTQDSDNCNALIDSRLEVQQKINSQHASHKQDCDGDNLVRYSSQTNLRSKSTLFPEKSGCKINSEYCSDDQNYNNDPLQKVTSTHSNKKLCNMYPKTVSNFDEHTPATTKSDSNRSSTRCFISKSHSDELGPEKYANVRQANCNLKSNRREFKNINDCNVSEEREQCGTKKNSHTNKNSTLVIDNLKRSSLRQKYSPVITDENITKSLESLSVSSSYEKLNSSDVNNEEDSFNKSKTFRNQTRFNGFEKQRTSSFGGSKKDKNNKICEKDMYEDSHNLIEELRNNDDNIDAMNWAEEVELDRKTTTMPDNTQKYEPNISRKNSRNDPKRSRHKRPPSHDFDYTTPKSYQNENWDDTEQCLRDSRTINYKNQVKDDRRQKKYIIQGNEDRLRKEYDADNYRTKQDEDFDEYEQCSRNYRVNENTHSRKTGNKTNKNRNFKNEDLDSERYAKNHRIIIDNKLRVRGGHNPVNVRLAETSRRRKYSKDDENENQINLERNSNNSQLAYDSNNAKDEYTPKSRDKQRGYHDKNKRSAKNVCTNQEEYDYEIEDYSKGNRSKQIQNMNKDKQAKNSSSYQYENVDGCEYSSSNFNHKRSENYDNEKRSSKKIRNHQRGNDVRKNRISVNTNEVENWDEEDADQKREEENEKKLQDHIEQPTSGKRIYNRAEINSRLSDLPSITSNLVNSTEKESVAGILKIPATTASSIQLTDLASPPVFPTSNNSSSTSQSKQMRQLYNPTNPSKPIIVPSKSTRAAVVSVPTPMTAPYVNLPIEQTYVSFYADHQFDASIFNFITSRASWYDEYSESFRSSNNPHLLLDIRRADAELQSLLFPRKVIQAWSRITDLRNFLQDSLKKLLKTDLKFCESENVEQHFWKIQFYNVIELLRKESLEDLANSCHYKSLLIEILNKGTEYFTSLLNYLEDIYKMKINDFSQNSIQSSNPMTKLAMNPVQKILIFLGDLARYKEDLEKTSNYEIARKWYFKAKELNPRNGKPFFQLGHIALNEKKLFDCVYYYMRSLMASNPFITAREKLIFMFDENRKKYEVIEKKRRDLIDKEKQEKAREKESVINGSLVRKEIWIRPDGSRNQKTTSTTHECNNDDQSSEYLSKLPYSQLSKQFLLSFLHVHGKLFTKVGTETLIETSVEMLKEFKVLLSQSPLQMTSTRLIQLMAFNMFAIENSKLTDSELESGYHSAIQESAIVISLQMFALIVNRCIQLLRQHMHDLKMKEIISKKYPRLVCNDTAVLLPAIKLWCDWLYCHTNLWNPPPSCQDYKIRGCGDCWSRIAILVNVLEELDYQNFMHKYELPEEIILFSNLESNTPECDKVKINLEEDIELKGFNPLVLVNGQSHFTLKNVDMVFAKVCLRIKQILFCGATFLCGLEPPVLMVQKTEIGRSEYISVVEEIITPKELSDNEITDNQYSDPEEEGKVIETENVHDEMLPFDGYQNDLLRKKRELERIQQKHEKHIKDTEETVKKEIESILVEMEIKPHYLVPDTNCFIDRLEELEKIAKAVSQFTKKPLYSMMIPVTVLSELEGISKGGKNEDVSEKARLAITFLHNRNSYPNIKCVTTKGSILTSTRFTHEEDYNKVENNDDKILTTCMNINKHSSQTEMVSNFPKKLYREVVLLTEDRNLRVKALSCNMPVETVSNFVKWAGLNRSK